jgi:N-acyl-L-homoserine lactone synthetase
MDFNRGSNHVKRDTATYRFIQAEGELRRSAIALHRQRYMEVGFMPPDFQDPYEKGSRYFVARHEGTQQLVGVCRLVQQELRTLPTYHHFELFEHERRRLEQLKPGTSTEFGALTKLPGHSDVTPGLIATALAHAAHHGMSQLLCCADQRLFPSLREHLGLPLRVIGREQPFYGSIKIPCVLNISEALEQLKVRKPQVLQQLALPPAAQEGMSAPDRAA